jgi:transcriptional regulator with XRE-family HTH domain
MKIQAYMTANKISAEAMAELIGGVTESGVRKWVYGERIPRPDQLRRIAEITKGEVMPNDFILAEAEPGETPAGQAA